MSLRANEVNDDSEWVYVLGAKADHFAIATRIGCEFIGSQDFKGSGSRQDFRIGGSGRNSWRVPLRKNSQPSSVIAHRRDRFDV